MQDANGSRFALLLGERDWGGCTLVSADFDPANPPTLASLWADRARRSAAPLEFDARSSTLSLTRRVARFRAGASDTPPDSERRLGAAADGNGNIYWVADGGRRIDVLSSGSRTSSVLWAMQAEAPGRAPLGDFAPLAVPAAAAPRLLRGLAITREHYLVAGVLPQDGQSGGLLVFDLLAGGPPLSVGWPADWPFVPHDFAARPCGGVAVLDRAHRRVWMLDRRLGMDAVFPVDTREAHPPAGFDSIEPGSTAPETAPIVRRPWFDLVIDSAGGVDPVAVEVLADDGMLVMDGAGQDGFALLSLYEGGTLAGRASTRSARDVIDAEDAPGFVLRGFDCALQPVALDAPPRLVVVSHEGNQCIAFDLFRGSPGLVLDPIESFLPLRRFGGTGLVVGRLSGVAGDTGLLYDSLGGWLPLVEQHRPRFTSSASLMTVGLDGRDVDCVWHRLVLDGCIPPGSRVDVETRAADDEGDLALLPFQAEPGPVLRPDGSEVPWLLDGPGAATDPSRGIGSWELLFQRARGRFIQLRLTLRGDELTTPRLVALRAWSPRFSYCAPVPSGGVPGRRSVGGFSRALSRQLRRHVHQPRRSHRRRVGVVRRAQRTGRDARLAGGLARPRAGRRDGRIAPPSADPLCHAAVSVPRHDARRPAGRAARIVELRAAGRLRIAQALAATTVRCAHRRTLPDAQPAPRPAR